MKISNKLIIAFSIFTLILIAEIVLNQIISEKAKESYTKLSSEIAPALEILDKCKNVNTEIYLLEILI